MDIGHKLKAARLKEGLTQDALAEKLGVSRQTISNWENSRSYPDIISIISLSDLYSISLDELLKEDHKMIEHLDHDTDVVKSRLKLSKLVLTMSYVIIWALLVAVFWLGNGTDAMGYALVTFYLALPFSTFIISIFIGKEAGWASCRWVMMLFFGAMYMLAEYATFSLANMAHFSFQELRFPQITAMLPGILSSAAGMCIGSATRAISGRRADRKAAR